mmetsp:Transcript_84431/g.272943  ORF Transcript_84431/g.272943 Transcript_84431/m.272943 type:complete len:955 (-) Transcript_84431:7-2871(-)
MSLRLCLAGRAVVSASDDRTARLWVAPGVELENAGGIDARGCDGTWACRGIFRGHGARLWDANLVPLSESAALGVATACEDSIVRLFALDGTLLRELRGHQTRGVRCVVVHPKAVRVDKSPVGSAHRVLVSGGEDGAVKVWPLIAAKQSQPASSPKDADAGSLFAKQSWKLPDSEDWIRELVLTSHDEAFVATNFGRLYKVCLQPCREQGDAPQVELIFSTEVVAGTNNITSLGVGPDASQFWLGSADGLGIVLTRPSGGHQLMVSRAQVFEGCRVSAVFASWGGHGAFTDHAGRASLWRCSRDDVSAQWTPTLLATARFASASGKGGKGTQRVLSAALMRLCIGVEQDAFWVFGDEQGALHISSLSGAVQRIEAHKGKVFSVRDVAADVASSGGTAFALSSGGDGVVMLHRFAASACSDPSGSRYACQRLWTIRLGYGLNHVAHVVPLTKLDCSAHDQANLQVPLLLGAFRSADFVLWDPHAGAEVWRHRCGGGKRPNCLLADWPTAPSVLGAAGGGRPQVTFVYSAESKSVEIHTMASLDGAVDASSLALAPRTLCSPMHGREIHAVSWVFHPTSVEPGLFVTAAEDTTLRLTRCGSLSDLASGAELRPLRVSERHPGSIRTIVVSPLPSHAQGAASALVFAGGAKSMLRAYLVDTGLSLRCVWSPVLPQRNGRSPSRDGEVEAFEERVMSVDCLAMGGSLQLVAAATSSGLLHAWHVDLSSAAAGRLDERSRVTTRLSQAAVLSLRCAPLPVQIEGAAETVAFAAFAGIADGSLVVQAALDLQQLKASAGRCSHAKLLDAGINDLAVHAAGDGRLLVAAAGDDHALALAVFALEPPSLTAAPPRLLLLSSRRLAGAHASAAKSVCWVPPQLVSVGLDRRLRVWNVEHPAPSGSPEHEQAPLLVEASSRIVRCLEPGALALGSAVEGSSGRPLIVAGRGVDVGVFLRSEGLA